MVVLCLVNWPAIARTNAAPDAPFNDNGPINVSKFSLETKAVDHHGIQVTLESDLYDPVLVTLTATRSYTGKLANGKRPEEFVIPYLQTTISAGSLKRG